MEANGAPKLSCKYRMERLRKTYLIKDTRGIIDAIMWRHQQRTKNQGYPLQLRSSVELPGVDTNILDPRDTCKTLVGSKSKRPCTEIR